MCATKKHATSSTFSCFLFFSFVGKKCVGKCMIPLLAHFRLDNCSKPTLQHINTT